MAGVAEATTEATGTTTTQALSAGTGIAPGIDPAGKTTAEDQW
jgi:hypothetical protein